MSAVELVIPVCPSLNNMFVNSRRGRVRSKNYSAWCIEAGWVLNGSGARPVVSPVAITMRFGKLNSASDLGNREKGITDMLVSHKLIEDDSVKHGQAHIA